MCLAKILNHACGHQTKCVVECASFPVCNVEERLLNDHLDCWSCIDDLFGNCTSIALSNGSATPDLTFTPAPQNAVSDTASERKEQDRNFAPHTSTIPSALTPVRTPFIPTHVHRWALLPRGSCDSVELIDPLEHQADDWWLDTGASFTGFESHRTWDHSQTAALNGENASGISLTGHHQPAASLHPYDTSFDLSHDLYSLRLPSCAEDTMTPAPFITEELADGPRNTTSSPHPPGPEDPAAFVKFLRGGNQSQQHAATSTRESAQRSHKADLPPVRSAISSSYQDVAFSQQLHTSQHDAEPPSCQVCGSKCHVNGRCLMGRQPGGSNSTAHAQPQDRLAALTPPDPKASTQIVDLQQVQYEPPRMWYTGAAAAAYAKRRKHPTKTPSAPCRRVAYQPSALGFSSQPNISLKLTQLRAIKREQKLDDDSPKFTQAHPTKRKRESDDDDAEAHSPDAPSFQQKKRVVLPTYQAYSQPVPVQTEEQQKRQARRTALMIKIATGKTLEAAELDLVSRALKECDERVAE